MSSYEEYLEYKAESIACGYEVMSYDEWLNPAKYIQARQDRLQEIYDNDEQDLY